MLLPRISLRQAVLFDCYYFFSNNSGPCPAFSSPAQSRPFLRILIRPKQTIDKDIITGLIIHRPILIWEKRSSVLNIGLYVTPPLFHNLSYFMIAIFSCFYLPHLVFNHYVCVRVCVFTVYLLF